MRSRWLLLCCSLRRQCTAQASAIAATTGHTHSIFPARPPTRPPWLVLVRRTFLRHPERNNCSEAPRWRPPAADGLLRDCAVRPLERKSVCSTRRALLQLDADSDVRWVLLREHESLVTRSFRLPMGADSWKMLGRWCLGSDKRRHNSTIRSHDAYPIKYQYLSSSTNLMVPIRPMCTLYATIAISVVPILVREPITQSLAKTRSCTSRHCPRYEDRCDC
eukprot:COSAG02_NODE_147_length_33939_cov_6.689539_3_plen_220_part_00